MTSLEAVLHQIEEEEVLELQNVFTVVDLDTAAEAQRRIAWFEEKKREVDAIIEKQIAPFLEKIEKIKMWGEQAKVEHEEKLVHYTNLLEQYMRNEVSKQLELGKKPRKTLSLPYGKISLKKQQPEFQKNEEELLEYAKVTGFVKVKESTDWASLKKNCVVSDGKLYDTTTGEEVPGVVVIERDEKFTVELND
ncbi:host-nuclease inhibitor Gam family protein [Cytobacillus praedii]|uniref:host-nuclease inhibitor Gam family protein n=1 Tax=Cytobacillus praedii TaxID=1742358 RepID=UPI00070E9CC0|nr:host-nuclease inhibitor Gam family protein [Cytobacillus praedii]